MTERIRFDQLTQKQAVTRRLLYIWVLFARCIEDAKMTESIKKDAPNAWKILCELHNILNAKKGAMLKELKPEMIRAVIHDMAIDEISDLLNIFDQVCDGDIRFVDEDKITK